MPRNSPVTPGTIQAVTCEIKTRQKKSSLYAWLFQKMKLAKCLFLESYEFAFNI